MSPFDKLALGRGGSVAEYGTSGVRADWIALLGWEKERGRGGGRTGTKTDGMHMVSYSRRGLLATGNPTRLRIMKRCRDVKVGRLREPEGMEDARRMEPSEPSKRGSCELRD